MQKFYLPFSEEENCIAHELREKSGCRPRTRPQKSGHGPPPPPPGPRLPGRRGRPACPHPRPGLPRACALQASVSKAVKWSTRTPPPGLHPAGTRPAAKSLRRGLRLTVPVSAAPGRLGAAGAGSATGGPLVPHPAPTPKETATASGGGWHQSGRMADRAWPAGPGVRSRSPHTHLVPEPRRRPAAEKQASEPGAATRQPVHTHTGAHGCLWPASMHPRRGPAPSKPPVPSTRPFGEVSSPRAAWGQQGREVSAATCHRPTSGNRVPEGGQRARRSRGQWQLLGGGVGRPLLQKHQKPRLPRTATPCAEQ